VAYEVSLRHMSTRYAAVVRFRALPSEMASRMPGAYREVAAFLARSAIEVQAPAIARYRQVGDASDVEAGFYVQSALVAGDEVDCIELPSGEAAATTHIGPYESLPSAYEAIQTWAKEQGRELAESMWEEYWSDPQSTAPSEWRTDVIWPLLPRG
jgi:effector-binding domain-containing protein